MKRSASFKRPVREGDLLMLTSYFYTELVGVVLEHFDDLSVVPVRYTFEEVRGPGVVIYWHTSNCTASWDYRRIRSSLKDGTLKIICSSPASGPVQGIPSQAKIGTGGVQWTASESTLATSAAGSAASESFTATDHPCSRSAGPAIRGRTTLSDAALPKRLEARAKVDRSRSEEPK